MSTSSSLVRRVARFLSKSPNDTIKETEFRDACVQCGVDLDSFTESDLEQLQEILNDL